jgi:NADH-quinone oxidoreductase subunit A
MGAEFTPIFLFILVGILTALGMLTASAILGPRKKTAVKQMPYESGMDPIGDARQRFDVRYYLVAIMFLLFDVELLYLYPWAVAQWSYQGPAAIAADVEPGVAEDRPSGAEGSEKPADGPSKVVAAGIGPVGIPPAFRAMVFWEIMVFVAVLTAAYAFAWRKGVFTWR